MEITFPGGKRVNAIYKGFTIQTDQPRHAEGEGIAPSPFDLFLASMGTCAGFYVLSFFQQRDMPVKGLKMFLETEKDREGKMLSKIKIGIKLPEGFPEKYRDTVVHSAGLCAVARHLKIPPAVEISLI